MKALAFAVLWMLQTGCRWQILAMVSNPERHTSPSDGCAAREGMAAHLHRCVFVTVGGAKENKTEVFEAATLSAFYFRYFMIFTKQIYFQLRYLYLNLSVTTYYNTHHFISIHTVYVYTHTHTQPHTHTHTILIPITWLFTHYWAESESWNSLLRSKLLRTPWSLHTLRMASTCQSSRADTWPAWSWLSLSARTWQTHTDYKPTGWEIMNDHQAYSVILVYLNAISLFLLPMSSVHAHSQLWGYVILSELKLKIDLKSAVENFSEM